MINPRELPSHFIGCRDGDSFSCSLEKQDFEDRLYARVLRAFLFLNLVFDATWTKSGFERRL